MMARLKINFNKTEVVLINDHDNLAKSYADIFNCQIGYFPIKYLGVPVSPVRLHVRDWLPLLEKMQRGWMFGKGHLCRQLVDPLLSLLA